MCSHVHVSLTWHLKELVTCLIIIICGAALPCLVLTLDVLCQTIDSSENITWGLVKPSINIHIKRTCRHIIHSRHKTTVDASLSKMLICCTYLLLTLARFVQNGNFNKDPTLNLWPGVSNCLALLHTTCRAHASSYKPHATRLYSIQNAREGPDDTRK